MPRSAPGEVVARPSTVTWPVLGFSKPAIMFWSVDFPQPEGPSRQRNSFFSTDRVMSSSARTSVLRFRSRKVLLTFEISIVAISALPALNRGIALPVQDARHQSPNCQVAEIAEQSDAGHGGEHEVVAQEIIGIPEHIPAPRLGGIGAKPGEAGPMRARPRTAQPMATPSDTASTVAMPKPAITRVTLAAVSKIQLPL